MIFGVLDCRCALSRIDIHARKRAACRVERPGVDDFPDGICLGAERAIWYGDVGSKRCVRVREGGQVMHTIDLDRGCFYCVLGSYRRTLFLVVNEWSGAENVGGGPRIGRCSARMLPFPAFGWP